MWLMDLRLANVPSGSIEISLPCKDLKQIFKKFLVKSLVGTYKIRRAFKPARASR